MRYLELPIVGQRVTIRSLAEIDEALRSLAAPWASGDGWSGTEIELALAKYGIVDRWCDGDARELERGLHGVAALRANGFQRNDDAAALSSEDAAVAREVSELGAMQLAALADELGACVLKLFLNDDMTLEEHMAPNLSRYRAGLPPVLPSNYFPRTFVVTDACLTNAPSIWLSKHFYL